MPNQVIEKLNTLSNHRLRDTALLHKCSSQAWSNGIDEPRAAKAYWGLRASQAIAAGTRGQGCSCSQAEQISYDLAGEYRAAYGCRNLSIVTAETSPAKANVLNCLGRKPSFTHKQLATVRNMREREKDTSTIASATGLSRQMAFRIKVDPTAAERMLARRKAAKAARKLA